MLFPILFTLGNILALLATMFLWGPCKQVKKMFDETRRIATSIYVISLIVTILVAVYSGKVLAVLLCVVIQCLALFWYSISYIPGARGAVKKCLGVA